MNLAFSLIRFSSTKQATGDSRRRQLEWSRAWADRHHYHLDESLHADKLAVSAFRSANVEKGPLAAFLDMIERGRVPKGSVLLVESLDRLSRAQLDDARELFRKIIKSGVDIVTMIPERRYGPDSLNNIFDLVEPLLIMSRAHEESLTKSRRIEEQWSQRRKQASRDKPLNSLGPAWLRLEESDNGRRWELIQDRAAVVRRIFKLCIEGHGLHAIAQRLNREKVPLMRPQWAKEKWQTREWGPTYISNILHNRAVLGEIQPHVMKDGKRVAIGEPLQGYYPRVVSDAVFHRAAAATAARRSLKGPRGKHCRNLFTGILFDATDGRNMVTVSESDKCKTVKLISSGGERGLSSYRTFRLDLLENAFLSFVKELSSSDVLPRERSDAEDEIDVLAGRIEHLKRRSEQVRERLKGDEGDSDFKAGWKLFQDLESDKRAAESALESARHRQAASESEVLADAQKLSELLATAKNEQLLDLRVRIKQRIRELVSEMWLAWENVTNKLQFGVLQVHLVSGVIRQISIFRVNRGPLMGGAWGRSMIQPASATILHDLRSYRTDPKVRKLFHERIAVMAQRIEAIDSRPDSPFGALPKSCPVPAPSSKSSKPQRDSDIEVLHDAEQRYRDALEAAEREFAEAERELAEAEIKTNGGKGKSTRTAKRQ